METTRNARKTRVGMVTSNAMDKTITVSQDMRSDAIEEPAVVRGEGDK